MDLKKMNLVELSNEEAREIDGGWVWVVVGVVAVAIFAVGAYNGYKDTEQADKK